MDRKEFIEALKHRTNFTGEDLVGLDLTNLDLHNIDFTGANLQKADFSGTQFVKVRLDRVLANESNFAGCQFDDVSMQHSVFYGADFRNTDLRSVETFGSSFNNARFQEAILNFYSNEVMAELLRQDAKDSLEKQKIAGLLLLRPNLEVWVLDELSLIDIVSEFEREWLYSVARKNLNSSKGISHLPSKLLSAFQLWDQYEQEQKAAGNPQYAGR